MEQRLIKSDKQFIISSIIIAIAIICLWLLNFYLLEDNSDRGTFGDMFGTINSLFSGLALAGIILTILLQRKELALQRLELVETRNELRRTANAQETSSSALNRQAENLKISAELSALGTLLDYYTSQLDKLTEISSVDKSVSQYRQKINDCVKRIENILSRKQMFDLDF